MAQRFSGKTVLVTGSAGGLGRAIAESFAGEGAALVLVDIDAARLDATRDEMAAAGHQVMAIAADLSDEAAIARIATEFARQHDSLDVLVNNAGLAYGEVSTGFFGLGLDKWQLYFTVNTIAPLLLAEALRAPLAAAKGLIINQSSMASYVPGTAYGITKSALNAVTFALASQLAGDGIRCAAVAPGMMETEANIAALGKEQIAGLTSMQLAPARSGGATDIANACLFLASEEGSFVNNTVLNVDAGHRMRGFHP